MQYKSEKFSSQSAVLGGDFLLSKVIPSPNLPAQQGNQSKELCFVGRARVIISLIYRTLTASQGSNDFPPRSSQTLFISLLGANPINK